MCIRDRLNVKLSGPRIYNNRVSTDAWLNADAPDATPRSVWEALKLFNKVIIILIFLFFLMGLIFK